jgi:hypothetical protein
LRDVTLHNRVAEGNLGTSYGGNIGLKPRFRPDMESTLLHELQHEVQNIEGTAKGGQSAQFRLLDHEVAQTKRALEQLQTGQYLQKELKENPTLTLAEISEKHNKRYGRPITDTEESFSGWHPDMLQSEIERYQRILRNAELGGYEGYHRLAGETEARNVQARRNMTAEERRATPPWKTQDVPDEQQIVRFRTPEGSAQESRSSRRGGIGDNGGPPLEDLPNYSLDPQGRPLFSPYSRVKQDIPLSETSPIYGRGGAKQLPRTPFDLGRIKEGDVLFPFVGDRTYAGRDLAGIQIGDRRVMFKKPVPSEGGAGFASRAVNPQDAWWASNRDPILRQEKILQNVHDRLQAEGKGGKIIGATVGMAAEGGDFSVQTARTAIGALKMQPLAKEARDTLYSAIDDAMKAPWGTSFPAVPDWPGMHKITDRALRTMKGTHRSKLVKILDTSEMKKQGAPNMAAVRKAASDPEQVNDRSLTAGRSFFEFGERPKALSPEDVRDPHHTYPWQVASPGGEFLGTAPMPAEQLFPDWGAGAQGMDMAQQQKSITTKMPVQRVTPEVLATIEKWLKSPQGQKLGIAGAVAAGLITAEQAQMFGSGGGVQAQAF